MTEVEISRTVTLSLFTGNPDHEETEKTFGGQIPNIVKSFDHFYVLFLCGDIEKSFLCWAHQTFVSPESPWCTDCEWGGGKIEKYKEIDFAYATWLQDPRYVDMIHKQLRYKIVKGGIYQPNNCRARQKIAFIIPFRWSNVVTLY